MMLVARLDKVKNLLDINKALYLVDEEAISLDGKPEVAVINLKPGSNPAMVLVLAVSVLAALGIHVPTALAQEKVTLKGHTNFVWAVSWSPDGKSLAPGSWDKTVKLWDVATGKVKATLTSHTGEVFSVTWAPDGRTLALGSVDKTVKLWDANPRK